MDPPTSFREQGHTRFIVEFSPDEMLVAVTRFKDKTIVVLDLEAGDPLSIIDTGMEVYDQRAVGSTIVAVVHEKAITWDLPTGDHVLNPEANVIRTATISCPRMFSYSHISRFVSISPDLHNIAIVEGPYSVFSFLHLHDVTTGQCLGSVPMRGRGDRCPWFTPDGREVWYITDRGEANGLTITKGNKSGVIKLEQLGPTNQPPSTPPWLSSRGYQIMDDGWILGTSGKRLLWLPPHWRSLDTEARMWSGRFLALLHSALPEAVILELEE
ncbi:hypothetical protein BDM02DRAFT_270538 [Thelephora ganbajun]|uniref:Uncharacterized protein n=1 Tax=Thelephora ganbajun TaxID=370292 RepID=A0ACB6ZA97_THEGA|nr:hypothetical protein BDM02DRAFT_270538 [Thelephora ganbajun]